LLSRKKTKPDEYDNMVVRESIALAPIWQAYQSFYPSRKDLVPRTFNRHATFCTTSARHRGSRRLRLTSGPARALL